MKTLKVLGIVVACFLILDWILHIKNSKFEIPSDITFRIEKEELDEPVKDNMIVILNKKVSKDVLEKVSKNFRIDRMKYENLMIGYVIEGTQEYSGGEYWANADIDKTCSVYINGNTDAYEDSCINKAKVFNEGKQLGRWYCIPYHCSMIFYDKDNKIMSVDIYPNSISKPIELTKKIVHNHERYDHAFYDKIDIKNHEYFKINSKGELVIADTTGVYCTSRKI